MADPRVAEAVVVRRRDSVWGEVPAAFVALHPEFPRSTSGNVERQLVERWTDPEPS